MSPKQKVNPKSLFISADITIKQAMKKLNETAEKILFVVNERSALTGTVSDGDIRRGLIHGLTFSDKVAKIMHKDCFKISEEEPDKVKVAKNIMLKNEIEQIPVVDKKNMVIDVILWTDIFDTKQRGRRKPLSNPVVIMAGGKGARLDPFTRILPKPLIPIGNKPIIEILMEKFSSFGFSRFIFTLNYKKEYIKMFLAENKFDYSIDWVEEKSYLGTAGAISLLKDKVKDTFFVTNCDIILDSDYAAILDWHKSHKNLITIIGCHKEIMIPYGILEADNGLLGEFIEKPRYDVLINTGVYVLEPSVISLIPKGKCIDMNTLIEMARKKGRVSIYPVYDGWLDIGQWDEYKKSLQRLSGTMNLELET